MLLSKLSKIAKLKRNGLIPIVFFFLKKKRQPELNYFSSAEESLPNVFFLVCFFCQQRWLTEEKSAKKIKLKRTH